MVLEASIGAAFILFANIILRSITHKLNKNHNKVSYDNYRLKIICDEDKEIIIRTIISQNVNNNFMMLTNMENSDLENNKVRICATFRIDSEKNNLMEELINRIVIEPGVTSSGWKKINEVVKHTELDDDEEI